MKLCCIFEKKKDRRWAPKCGPVFKTHKAKNLNYPDIGASAFMRDHKVHTYSNSKLFAWKQHHNVFITVATNNTFTCNFDHTKIALTFSWFQKNIFYTNLC